MRRDQWPLSTNPGVEALLRSKNREAAYRTLHVLFNQAAEKLDGHCLDALDETGVILASALKVYLEGPSQARKITETSLRGLWLQARDQVRAGQLDAWMGNEELLLGFASLWKSIDYIALSADTSHNSDVEEQSMAENTTRLMMNVAHAFTLYLFNMDSGWIIPF